jgi:hypothetical protein
VNAPPERLRYLAGRNVTCSWKATVVRRAPPYAAAGPAVEATAASANVAAAETRIIRRLTKPPLCRSASHDAPRPGNFLSGTQIRHVRRTYADALDSVGGLHGVAEFPVTPAGYARLLGWLGGFGTVCLVGRERTGSYGAGLARHVTAAGVRVVEVDRSDRQDNPGAMAASSSAGDGPDDQCSTRHGPRGVGESGPGLSGSRCVSPLSRVLLLVSALALICLMTRDLKSAKLPPERGSATYVFIWVLR